MPQVPQKILELIDRFHRNIESYRRQAYNETQVRQEFINPFFEALGWDIINKSGYAEAYKDVIHEDAIKVGNATKAPDYCFRIGGVRKFFLEAKKPSVSIKDEASPAYQLRRYAWSAKLPLSILTDFEEFAVYDCRIRPLPTDKASVGRILYLTYPEYAARWEEIASIFSKEAVLQGSFDKFVTGKGRRGTSEVDAEFLTEIEGWRDALARNIALRNPRLTIRELNFAVQRTIDRIIFLRMCEDRGIEIYGQLMGLLNGENIYDRLQYLYRLADDRYNSGLFHFKAEKGRREDPDELTLRLKIDDKVLKEIIRHLYYPESPYEFSVLSADILGNVYEQFLGKVIRLTPGHRAVVEEKPEVKKAGGVYYTPAYIVDYIVRNTVGKLCEGKTPKQITKLRILDPACGSGSFLIGAYAYLLNYHRDWYLKDGAEKHTKEIYQGAGGQWHLTTQEKRRILLNNIHGVDIDNQAVEVTKLSLLLKVLEGENQDSLSRQLKMWRERALPDLGNNIKCGNSLIGPDYYKGQQVGLFDVEEAQRINAFDWRAEFPEIMKAGGFDAVIGNPPYIRIQTMKEWAPLELEIYKQHYASAGKGNYDIYVVFVEKGLQLLNKTGRLGFILPHKFFNAQYGEPLRQLISQGRHLSEVVYFDDQQVFAGATTYTCLLFLERAVSNQCQIIKVDNLHAWRVTGQATKDSIPAKSISASEWVFNTGVSSILFKKLSKIPTTLGDMADRIFQGLITGADSVFILENLNRGRYFSEATQKEHKLESELMHPLCKGSLNIKRYHITDLNKAILFPYKLVQGEAALLSVKELTEKYPHAWEYLKANKTSLESREHGKWKHERWYAFGRSQNLSEMEQVKILTPSIAKQASFTLDSSNFYYFVGSGGGGGGGYGITLKQDGSITYEYVLGLLNSRLLDIFLKAASSTFSGGYYAYNRQYVERLPIKTINFSVPIEKSLHDQIVILVGRMLDLCEKLKFAKTPDNKARLQRQIDSTDQQINQLVYELYELTPEEIAIVEGSSVDSKAATWDNENDENGETKDDRPRSAERPTSGVAEEVRHAGEGRRSTQGGAPGAGGSIDVVREPAGEYGPPEDPTEEDPDTIESTRLFETAEGKLSYPQLSERLALSLAHILEEILQSPPDQIVITSEWLCLRHQALAGGLFPNWAGRYRDVNVQVGEHLPPPFYEVPILMRLFCEDLAERLRHTPPRNNDAGAVAELLAWVDWRFQWIHPFKDFNGRIGRVLLATLLYKLALPHVITAPTETNARAEYLQALRAADQGNLRLLINVWMQRIDEAL